MIDRIQCIESIDVFLDLIREKRIPTDVEYLRKVSMILSFLDSYPRKSALVFTEDPALPLYLVLKFPTVIAFHNEKSFKYFSEYRRILLDLSISPANLRVVFSRKLVVNYQSVLVDFSFQDDDSFDTSSAVSPGGFLVEKNPSSHDGFTCVDVLGFSKAIHNLDLIKMMDGVFQKTLPEEVANAV